MNKIIFSFVISTIVLTCGSVAAFGQKTTRKTSPKAKTITAKSKAAETKKVSAKRKQSSKKDVAATRLSRPDGIIMRVSPGSPEISTIGPSSSQPFRLGEKAEPSETTSFKIGEQIAGGVVNGKAINLVTPPYPPQAKAVRASGQVSVQVLIDENGDVVSATAVSGN
ncbi:MAG: hypothetical protein H7Z37_03360, partial [Pyrinomonadaceae bacterium]|nr:hypothetical protein [Pyrinomonadaceae bacterium]